MIDTRPWRELSPKCWQAQADDLGVEYCLEAGEGTMRSGTAWSLVWDCPSCERRVDLKAEWHHTDPCGEACLCQGWRGDCRHCSATLAILFWPAQECA